MLGNSSFSLSGATPKNPITGINSFLNKSFGVPLPVAPKVSNPVRGPQPLNMSMAPKLGTNPGVLQSTAPVAKTVSSTGETTHYVTKPNPNVLEQQKALNKLGAGLVEDGIVGPKTREAIAKYSNANNPTPTPTPTPAPAPEPKIETPTTPPAPSPALTVAEQIPNIQKAGELTPLEKTALGNEDLTKARELLAEQIGLDRKKIADIYSQPIPIEFQQGRAQVVQKAQLEKENALQGLINNALLERGQTIGGAQTQANRALTASTGILGAVAPQFPSYGAQIIQPGLLGKGGGVGSGSLDDAVSTVVARLQDGTMTYNDALSALAGYGQGGLNALQKALPPGFNIAQSNTLGGQQGSVKVNYQLADTALKNVESIISELGKLQKTNVPLINRTANWISTQFGVGSKETRAMTGAVQSLRNAYASLLASVKGGTPTDYSSQAMAEIPAEPTPNDISAIRKNFETLGQARTNILGNPGQAGTSGGSTGGFAEVW